MSTKTMTQPAPSSPAYIRHRTNQQRHHFEKSDDADVAAGIYPIAHRSNSNSNSNSNSPIKLGMSVGSETDLLVSRSNSFNMKDGDRDETLYATITHSSTSEEKHGMQSSRDIRVFGCDISHLSRKSQFLTCASGIFTFSLLYGFLQELISVTLCNRQLGLFLAMMQFMGYAIWSKLLNSYVQRKQSPSNALSRIKHGEVPIKYYIFLSILRAIDASMTNMAMAYVNYPAKTLMKSSRVVFTMLFGTIVSRKRYKPMDYLVVLLMVAGLVIFMHADSQSSAVFQPLGIIMLTTSLCCDAVINNLSERIMNQYNVGQDEFIYKLYSIALVGIVGAAAARGDLLEGSAFLLTPGTYGEIVEGGEASWSVSGKIFAFVLFSSTGFLGSSCSALITKEFGALTMSLVSTTRKAATLFLSFALFKENVCTLEHLGGIGLFVTALVGKSIRASRKGHGGGGGGTPSSESAGHRKKEGRFQPQTRYEYMEAETTNADSHHRTDGIKRRRNIGDIV